MDDCVLRIESVTKKFPGVIALKDAHLQIHPLPVHKAILRDIFIWMEKRYFSIPQRRRKNTGLR